MPGNKYLLADRTKLLSTKLDRLSTNLQGKLGGSFQTQEEYVFEAVKVLNEFYRSLQEPLINEQSIANIREDDLPDADLFNELWNQVLDDLTTVFTELENLGDLTLANFNFITTESNRLTARLKAVSSLLGDYILYSLNPSRDAFFFKDSFNDLSKVDILTGLLNETQGEINQTEGIVTLPLNTEVDSFITITASPIINPNSNGVVGNNQELGAVFNGDISVLLDNNPDTWFEYERVVTLTTDDKEALVLDLTINLGDPRVINHVRVNPNNFGTKTVIQIDSIDTSLDGEVYTSIKDDIPISGFTTADEENIFALAPSTSKFAGQGLYTFTPRQTKYIRFVFRQTEPYTIETPAGQRLRYAIGLRDIDIRGYNYLNRGEIISQAFNSIDEIRKVSLQTNQNPTQLSELGGIDFSVSPDDGASWYRIQPQEFDGPSGIESIAEILNFNSGDADSINTAVPVNSLRLKATMFRTDENFVEGSSAFQKRTVTKAEVHKVPTDAPFVIDLEENPVTDSVVLVDPGFGSRGDERSPYILGHGKDRIDSRKYRLPFQNLPRPLKKISNGTVYGITNYDTVPVNSSEWFHLEVGGEEWTQANQTLDSYAPLDFNDIGNYKVFTFDPNKGIIEFGDGLTNTVAPKENSPIGVWFDRERIYPSEDEDAHKARLEFFTSANKESFKIFRYDDIEETTEILNRKATIINLANNNIVDTTNIASILLNQLGRAAAPKTFLNGKDELTSAGDWSIDTERGIIYLLEPTPANRDVSISYTHQPIYELTNDEWDWDTTSALRDSVTLKETAWRTRAQREFLPAEIDSRVIDLSKFSVAKETLTLSVSYDNNDLDESYQSNPFIKEVDFIDGVTELGGEVIKTKETIPTLVPTLNVATFSIKQNISENANDYQVLFSDTLLFDPSLEQASAATVNSAGEWHIERDSLDVNYGVVTVYTTVTVNTPGTITYYYNSPNFADNGLYSVDYNNGRIFTQRKINNADNAALDAVTDPNFATFNPALLTITASYQYTDFRAQYRIARLLNTAAYEVDVTNQTVTISDEEVLRFQAIPKGSLKETNPVYLVNYEYVAETRENITGLRDLFSPVLKDYALKILTKRKLF